MVSFLVDVFNLKAPFWLKKILYFIIPWKLINVGILISSGGIGKKSKN